MHHLSTSFVLAYHGCDRDLGKRLLSGSASFKPSENDFDWLGPGVYFWESNPHRALEFAQEKHKRGERVRNPFVVGAVIDLGLCLDLTTKDSLENLRDAHRSLLGTIPEGGLLPVNGPKTGDGAWTVQSFDAFIRFSGILKHSQLTRCEAPLRKVILSIQAPNFLKRLTCKLR